MPDQPLREIRAQREALLSGRWVRGTPQSWREEACQVIRTEGPMTYCLGAVACRAVGLAQVKLGYKVYWGSGYLEMAAQLLEMLPSSTQVNDQQYRSADEALTVLDEAELLLKQAGFTE